MSETWEKRFWPKVNKGEDDQCWPWTAATFRDGYGMLLVNGRSSYAHRLSYLLHKGEDPAEQHVRHTCDNPGCVNPTHLELGTHADNMRDMAIRGRTGNAKLTPDQVREARVRAANGETHRSISEDLGVGRKTITDAIRRDTWKHLP